MTPNKSDLPQNEPILGYAPGSPEKLRLQKKLTELSHPIQIPCIIGGQEIKTSQTLPVIMPHSHQEVIAEAFLAGKDELRSAIGAAQKAKYSWEMLSWKERAQIFQKAADLLSGPWRDTLNAATMLGQSKNVFQAEIDSACELIDFLRFNAYFYQEILKDQPLSPPGVQNSMEYRPLEGFVAAITPFNFTAIAGNLPATPALLGNTVIWKPSDTQLLSAYYTYKLFEAAGLPPGVINFVPARSSLAGEVFLNHPDLGGIHFTGSTSTFYFFWKTIGTQIEKYKSFPRLVGETGGKDFVFIHPSENRIDALSTALIRGAYEYQGQKCSAASRVYVPQSIWPKLKKQMLEELETIRVGDVRDFSCFMNAVIDAKSFNKILSYFDLVKNNSNCKIIFGGTGNSEKGFFITPTLIETTDPKSKTMCEEIFGPVLTVYAYDDTKLEETLKLCDETSPYALTGAIFAQDERAIHDLSLKLRYAAGNFYINDKPTGAVVAQQPFGGARASGTNDKAGSKLNLYRWISPRVIKRTHSPPTHYGYPFLS